MTLLIFYLNVVQFPYRAEVEILFIYGPESWKKTQHMVEMLLWRQATRTLHRTLSLIFLIKRARYISEEC